MYEMWIKLHLSTTAKAWVGLILIKANKIVLITVGC